MYGNWSTLLLGVVPLDLSHDLAVRWNDPDPKHVSLLREAAIDQVLIAHPHEEFERACRSAGIGVTPEDQVQFATLKELMTAAHGKPLVLREGQWPGIGHGPNIQPLEDEIASASSQPWVDSNGSWIAYLRALFPNRPPALGYLPNLGNRVAPFDSLELALIEAWAAGGNYVMALDPRFRAALLKGDEKARGAWRQLGRTAGWLQQHTELFRQPTFPSITQLVEEGESTAEIAHMLFRQNASPALVNAAEPPAPDPERRRVIVAVELRPPLVPVRNRILDHAQAGASVVVNGDWWQNSSLTKVKSQEDRDFYRLGRGQVVAYHKTIDDPSEFALDAIDILTHPRRGVRLWNAPAVIALATGKSLLQCVNYGSPADRDIQARILGTFAKATLVRPEAAALPLKAVRRGATTEVMIPELGRLGVVVFG
jgi:hypothetical protein